LSREILALAVYSVSLFVILILGWNNRGFEFLGYLLALSSAFGAAFLWMMTRIYVIPTIPPWNSWYTGLSFLSTTFGLGLMSILLFHHGLLVRAGCETCYEQFLNDGTTRMLVVSLGLVLLVELIGGFVHQSRLVKINTGIDRPVCDRGIFYRFFLARMAILVLLLVLVAMILFKSAVLTGDGSRGWVYLLPALVITQALIGRLLFFSSYSRVGV
jgi:DMSO reductase anchor subunit